MNHFTFGENDNFFADFCKHCYHLSHRTQWIMENRSHQHLCNVFNQFRIGGSHLINIIVEFQWLKVNNFFFLLKNFAWKVIPFVYCLSAYRIDLTVWTFAVKVQLFNDKLFKVDLMGMTSSFHDCQQCDHIM